MNEAHDKVWRCEFEAAARLHIQTCGSKAARREPWGQVVGVPRKRPHFTRLLPSNCRLDAATSRTLRCGFAAGLLPTLPTSTRPEG